MAICDIFEVKQKFGRAPFAAFPVLIFYVIVAFLFRVLECQGLPIVNGQCDPYATVTLAGPYRLVTFIAYSYFF